MKIVNTEDGTEVAPNELGEIVIRGVNVMLGYWNRPAETAKVMKDGWFHTGDIGKIDELGYFYIVDRVKDMINSGGLKIYPAEVENIIYQHPSVAEVAVYGVPHPLMGEQVQACIVLKPGALVTEEEIICFTSKRIAHYKVTSKVVFVDSIPKNPTGKILKRLLREKNSSSVVKVVETIKPQKSLQQDLPSQSSEKIANWISDWMSRKLFVAIDEIDRHKSFADYGMDSLKAVKLTEDLSTWLQWEILPTVTWNFSTVDSLARHLTEGNIAQNNQSLPTKTLLNSESSDLPTLEDAELAELLAQEIAALQQRR